MAWLEPLFSIRSAMLRRPSRQPGNEITLILRCSPFPVAGTKIHRLLARLFSAASTEQGTRHDHEPTVDHALMRGLVTA
jgi:hypothetical protein